MDAFGEAVGRLREELGERVTLRYVGPLPPYSFADDRPERGDGGMGLITGLLTLPLAPVRGTVWLAERIQEQAEDELYDESAISAGPAGARGRARRPATSTRTRSTAAEDALIERLMEIRGLAGEESRWQDRMTAGCPRQSWARPR